MSNTPNSDNKWPEVALLMLKPCATYRTVVTAVFSGAKLMCSGRRYFSLTYRWYHCASEVVHKPAIFHNRFQVHHMATQNSGKFAKTVWCSVRVRTPPLFLVRFWKNNQVFTWSSKKLMQIVRRTTCCSGVCYEQHLSSRASRYSPFADLCGTKVSRVAHLRFAHSQHQRPSFAETFIHVCPWATRNEVLSRVNVRLNLCKTNVTKLTKGEPEFEPLYCACVRLHCRRTAFVWKLYYSLTRRKHAQVCACESLHNKCSDQNRTNLYTYKTLMQFQKMYLDACLWFMKCAEAIVSCVCLHTITM